MLEVVSSRKFDQALLIWEEIEVNLRNLNIVAAEVDAHPTCQNSWREADLARFAVVYKLGMGLRLRQKVSRCKSTNIADSET